MRILTTSTAFPKHYYTQQQIAEELCRYWEQSIDIAVLERLHGRTGVDGRYFSRPLDEYRSLDTWGKANNVWIETALDLGEQAIECLLRQSGVRREQIGAIFFVSVTGVASPSIDARLVNRMGLPRSIRRNPIFGLGCVAGAAGLARVADYVKAYPDQYAVLLSVELCSLTWQRGDVSVANLISTGLFGDGAAAVLVGGAQTPALAGAGPRILDHAQVFYPGTEDVMGWDISERGFQIVLSPEVPQVVRENLGGDVDRFLAGHGLTRADIGCWLMHTGGPKVLEASEEALGLEHGALVRSWEALRRVGNLSSASVLVVLDDVMKQHRPAPGTKSLLAAMGPGFCAEMLLLEW
ncbi:MULTISPECIES: 3-oxoacyl-[acyl-carrier-protein] synthase III C-terminal domain-containing protein [Acidobacterium]|uniref:Chalcone/stilbene synthase family protein n=1 Tax=Acidobacterium capsulatum (strain ATCC 51196 / DSM 11244 / BCRC 80197 / JCM 7670 / NBRC 15755 / NCIMB 13165 / 161) TaxID=240015 RepID=C1F687_ACIC5|nr:MULTISPECIES: 3-oxoacyl-[acyl-carrier-protein] synthase III C-terminal domain-containing protein [Acidobacterium]ACO32650.1 Chalcone/stilbene synthase family protein [Acidobacterium capsulatum ATCC 51196]HCT61139.1 type III polyketide synthase [Acidobacterium sp.]